MSKFGVGAWVPLFIGIVAFTMMRTWRRGQRLLRAEVRKGRGKLDDFVMSLLQAPPHRVNGTAVFLTSDPNVVPNALVHNLRHNQVLHQQNILLHVEGVPIPHAPVAERLKIDALGEGFCRVTVRFGFMEISDVPKALKCSSECAQLVIDPDSTTYFTSRESVLASKDRRMHHLRDKIIAVMHRNAAPPSAFYRIPSDRLVDLGSNVQI